MKTLDKLFADMIKVAKESETRVGAKAAPGSVAHHMYQFAAEGNRLLRQLTPAQQFAEELVATLRAIETPLTVREQGLRLAVLNMIAPPVPPTLEEALDALMTMADGASAVMAGTWDADAMQADRNAANAIIARARATGVLK